MTDIIHHYIFLKDDNHWNLQDAKRLLEERNADYTDIEESDTLICFNTKNKKEDTSSLRLLPLTPLVFLLLEDLGDEEPGEEKLQCNDPECDKTLCQKI